MGRERQTAEQIIAKLWAVKIDPGKGMSTVREAEGIGQSFGTLRADVRRIHRS